MSWSVDCSGKTIWEPALIVGRMFLDELKVLERVFKCRSGIVDNFDDTMEIDQVQLDRFIQRGFATLDRTNSGPVLALSEGCFAIAIALDARITGRWPTAPAHVLPIVELPGPDQSGAPGRSG